MEREPGTVLYKRLVEHQESIQQASNLEVVDFHCQYLAVDDIWIPLGESLLIERFRPVWNVVLDGFGNHDPGGRRSAQFNSPWDVVHPGRPWAVKLAKNPKSAAELLGGIKAYLQEAK